MPFALQRPDVIIRKPRVVGSHNKNKTTTPKMPAEAAAAAGVSSSFGAKVTLLGPGRSREPRALVLVLVHPGIVVL